MKIHTFAFDQFCSCYEMVKGNVFVHGRFCRIDCGRQRFFSQKEVRVCASTSLFSIANKEPAAFISFQEIITPLTSFPAFGEKLLFLIASLTFFLALFTLSVALLFYERRVSYVRLKSVFWQERYSCYVLCRMLD